MTCLECKKPLSYLDHRQSMERFRAELCKNHYNRMDRLVRRQEIPEAAVMLYYGLKEAGIPSMLAWWDGRRTVDLAISRVKLNIEIDRGLRSLTAEQAIVELEATMQAFQHGFSTIRIPEMLIRNHLQDTIEYIRGIIEGLRANIKVV